MKYQYCWHVGFPSQSCYKWCKSFSSDCLGSTIFAPIKADISGNITVSVVILLWLELKQFLHSSSNHLFLQYSKIYYFTQQKIKAVYDTNPGRFKTLQHILEAEKEMHGAEWPKVGATLALMWLKRFGKPYICVSLFLLLANSVCIITVHIFFINRALRFVQVFLQSLVDGEKDDSNPNLIRVNITKAYEIALKKYHSWLVQQLFKVSSECQTYPRQQMYDLLMWRGLEWCVNLVYMFVFRRHSMLLRISLISWRPCPRVGMWRKRNARRKSENSSSTFLPLLMLYMSCTVKWMLILTTQCE